jgi:hypothetical protein
VRCQKYLPGPCTSTCKLYAALIFSPFHQNHEMGRRGPELSPQLRSRICELRSLRWSYAKIQEKHPEILLSTIRYTCQKEASQLNNVSKPRTCDELSQYRNSDASRIERKPVQLVVLIQESKAKEGRRRTKQLSELLISGLQVTCETSLQNLSASV